MMLANSHKFSAVKIGDGYYGASKDQLVDGIFKLDDQKIAISMFSSDEEMKGAFFRDFASYIQDIAREIKEEYFNKVFLVFNSSKNAYEDYSNEYKNTIELIDKELSSNIYIYGGQEEDIFKYICDALKITYRNNNS